MTGWIVAAVLALVTALLLVAWCDAERRCRAADARYRRADEACQRSDARYLRAEERYDRALRRWTGTDEFCLDRETDEVPDGR